MYGKYNIKQNWEIKQCVRGSISTQEITQNMPLEASGALVSKIQTDYSEFCLKSTQTLNLFNVYYTCNQHPLLERQIKYFTC